MAVVVFARKRPAHTHSGGGGGVSFAAQRAATASARCRCARALRRRRASSVAAAHVAKTQNSLTLHQQQEPQIPRAHAGVGQWSRRGWRAFDQQQSFFWWVVQSSRLNEVVGLAEFERVLFKSAFCRLETGRKAEQTTYKITINHQRQQRSPYKATNCFFRVCFHTHSDH